VPPAGDDQSPWLHRLLREAERQARLGLGTAADRDIDAWTLDGQKLLWCLNFWTARNAWNRSLLNIITCLLRDWYYSNYNIVKFTYGTIVS
jgi:hypothetical protein